MDLCPGIGNAAIASAELGASSVTAWGASPAPSAAHGTNPRYPCAEVTPPTLDASAAKGCYGAGLAKVANFDCGATLDRRTSSSSAAYIANASQARATRLCV
jgi:hypothetical protein